MVKLTENSDEIVIQYVPVKEWIVAGILTLLLSFCGIWLISLLFIHPQNLAHNLVGENLKSWMDGTLIVIILLITLVIALEIKVFPIFRVYRAAFTILKINHKAQNIEIFRQRIYGKRIERYYFSQVSKVKSSREKSLFFESYLLNLFLANQKQVKWEIPIGNKKEATKLVRKFNKIIKLSKKDQHKQTEQNQDEMLNTKTATKKQ